MLSSAVAGIADGGGAYALLAVVLILIYRTTGVLNFAIAAVGTFGTMLTSVVYGAGVPLLLAALLGMAAGAGVSVVYGLVYVRWFFDAPQRYAATVAIALLLGTISLSYRVFGENPRYLPNVVRGNTGRIAGVVVSNSGVLALVLAIVVAVALTLVLHRTRLGRQLRGISQGPVTCELLGVPVRLLSVGVWGIGGAIGTLAMLLVAPGQDTQIESLALLVVPGLAAALVATFRYYWLAVVTGVLLGAAQGMLEYSNTLRVWSTAIPFIVILVILLWLERKEVWDEAR
jgi:branched-chain amino acid transport system permease protein